MTEHPAIAHLRAALDRAQVDAEYSEYGFMFFDGDVAVVEHYQRAGSPEAVLAQVAADRELIDEHSNVNDGDCGTCVDGNWGYPTHGGSRPQRWPCRTLLLRAKAWGWSESPDRPSNE